MLQSLSVDGSDLVDIKVEFRCLGWNTLGYLLQLGVTTSHNCSGAGAFRWTIVGAQAAHIIPV